MKAIYLILIISLAACNETVQETKIHNTSDSIEHTVDTTHKENEEKSPIPSPKTKSYSNTRFKEVTVEKVGEHTYSIEGKAQIFEANFGWVVEDGHEELKKGHQMTDAGAPEWGNFKFSVEVQKQRPNSTLTLILFESSPKDGSRQYELPIVLETNEGLTP